VILHVVLLRFKADLTSEDIKSFGQMVTDSCQEIAAVRRADVGRAVKVNAGYSRQFGESTYDAVAVLQFADSAGLLEYLNHPLHRELGRRFWQVSESVAVVEAETTNVKEAEIPQAMFSSWRRDS
jgi:hypothetical protein